MAKLSDKQLRQAIKDYFANGGAPSMKAIRANLESKFSKEQIGSDRERIKTMANELLEETENEQEETNSTQEQEISKKRKRDEEEETEQPPSKKVAATSSSSTPASTSGSKWKTDKEGKSYLGLGTKKRLYVNKFRNSVYVSFREFFQKDSEWLPTKKGVALTVDEWDMVKRNIGQIDQYINESS